MSRSNHSQSHIDPSYWEMRPSGMVVQRRDDDGGGGGPMIRINVSYGSSHHQVFLPSDSNFGDLKTMLAHKCDLQPSDQRLFFRGKEKEDDKERLDAAGLKDNSKLLLLEHQSSKDRKLEQFKKAEEISKACEAVAAVRAEVDMLSQRVAALQVHVHGGGTKVSDKEFQICTELLMRQLLKLDGIEAEGEARAQRKAQVRRVQGFVDTVDSLKARNSNPFSFSDRRNSVTVTTNWETFESGVGSLSAPAHSASSNYSKVTDDWEQFD